MQSLHCKACAPGCAPACHTVPVLTSQCATGMALRGWPSEGGREGLRASPCLWLVGGAAADAAAFRHVRTHCRAGNQTPCCAVALRRTPSLFRTKYMMRRQERRHEYDSRDLPGFAESQGPGLMNGKKMRPPRGGGRSDDGREHDMDRRMTVVQQWR